MRCSMAPMQPSSPGAAAFTSARTRPEVLAPAGDSECIRAAVENGADAVYFGLQKFNARARATNFTLEELPETMSKLHLRGVRGYIAFNTLIFSNELAEAESTIEKIIAAGVDALILQDLGIARLVRAISPDIAMHASTQTTMTCAEDIEAIRELGFERVILARELTLKEIQRIREKTSMPLEVFVHGALCVAYSGQCLTSEALGGRSANRGACAQACRQPYEMVVDGAKKELGDRRYLISPQDLAAYDIIPELIAAGVCSFKIEGRLKTPEYVAATTRAYRQAIDGVKANRLELEQVFSRGLSHGWLAGLDHQTLVPGLSPKKRGILLGRVEAVSGEHVRLKLEGSIKPGDGVCFDFGDPQQEEAGGRVYEVWMGRKRVDAADAPSEVELAFGEIDWTRVHAGDRVWKTDDPALNRRLRATFESVHRREPVDAIVEGRAGSPMRLTIGGVTVESGQPLETARKRPLTADYLREQIGRLGSTPFELRTLDLRLEGDVILPVSMINDLRRRAVEELEKLRRAAPSYRVERGALTRLRTSKREPSPSTAELVVLCRTMEQLGTALGEGCRTIELDFEDLRLYRDAVPKARDHGAWVALAPPRIHKPGEDGFLRFVAGAHPNAILARNLAHMSFYREHAMIGDFSLNIANDLTARWMMERGLTRYVPAHDLSMEQLEALLRETPASWAEVVVHQRMPMFHMEHCVFAALLSNGHDCTDCGRPCDRHDVRLRDWTGHEHPVKVDVGCRNTIYNAVAQSASQYVRRLLELGVRWFRVELLLETPAEARRLIRGYRDVVEGRSDGQTLWKELNASNFVGVTRGPLSRND